METSFLYHPSSFPDDLDQPSSFSSIRMMEKGDTNGTSSCYPGLLYSPFADIAVDTKVNECSYNQPFKKVDSSPIVFDVEANDQVANKMKTSVEIISRKEVDGSSLKTAQSKGPEETKSRKRKKRSNKLKEAQENKEKAIQSPPTGYVHVRARRGQATDSHSLAERVRRKKLTEKMKMLQSLVPGCDMMTSKITVLDEIINYMQYLQHTVEFLSMKLASVNQMFHGNGMDLDALMVKPNVHTGCSSASPLQHVQHSMPIPTAFVDDEINFNQPNHFPVLDSSASSLY